MALKILKKAEKDEPERTKLPEGADRFVWSELPPVVTPLKYAQILKHEPKKPT